MQGTYTQYVVYAQLKYLLSKSKGSQTVKALH